MEYVVVDEYGFGEFIEPNHLTVYFVDVDYKTVTEFDAIVQFSDSYIYDRIDIGEVDMVVTNIADVQHLIDEEGYKFIKKDTQV